RLRRLARRRGLRPQPADREAAARPGAGAPARSRAVGGAAARRRPLPRRRRAARRGGAVILESIDLGRPLAGPATIPIDVTNGCNPTGVTGWDHPPLLAVGRSAAWKRRRADPAAVEALLDDALGLGGLRAVIVSGMGEPFTHPDIYRILAAVKRRGLHLTVI